MLLDHRFLSESLNGNELIYTCHGDDQLKQVILILASILLSSCNHSDGSIHVLHDPFRNRPIKYEVWTPSGEGKYPLVLLSHGSGGDYSNHNWLIETLVENGYVVAAPNHPSNTTRDNSDAGVISVWERPADMSRLLDHLLNHSEWAALIDKERIGAAGFSSGGYTAIALGGAVYNRDLFRVYCTGKDHGPDCDLATESADVDYSRSSLPYRDVRIKAIFAMAPAVGPAITQESLEAISVPVFIIAAQNDELVYPDYSAHRYAQHIPQSRLEILPTGGHFVFLKCNIGTQVADWFITQFDLCGSNQDMDGDAIREEVGIEAITFFNNHIGSAP